MAEGFPGLAVNGAYRFFFSFIDRKHISGRTEANPRAHRVDGLFPIIFIFMNLHFS